MCVVYLIYRLFISVKGHRQSAATAACDLFVQIIFFLYFQCCFYCLLNMMVLLFCRLANIRQII